MCSCGGVDGSESEEGDDEEDDCGVDVCAVCSGGGRWAVLVDSWATVGMTTENSARVLSSGLYRWAAAGNNQIGLGSDCVCSALRRPAAIHFNSLARDGSSLHRITDKTNACTSLRLTKAKRQSTNVTTSSSIMNDHSGPSPCRTSNVRPKRTCHRHSAPYRTRLPPSTHLHSPSAAQYCCPPP